MKLKTKKSVALFVGVSILFFITCLWILPYTNLVYYKSYGDYPPMKTLEKYHGKCVDPCSMNSNLVYLGERAQRHNRLEFIFYVDRSKAMELKKELPNLNTCLKKTDLCL